MKIYKSTIKKLIKEVLDEGFKSTANKKEIENQCDRWSSEYLDSCIEEGGFTKSAMISFILDPPWAGLPPPAASGGDELTTSEEKKIVKDWVNKNWDKLNKTYKDGRANYKEKWS
jgi:hypothetical protein